MSAKASVYVYIRWYHGIILVFNELAKYITISTRY